jgi:hypothetical protein
MKTPRATGSWRGLVGQSVTRPVVWRVRCLVEDRHLGFFGPARRQLAVLLREKHVRERMGMDDIDRCDVLLKLVEFRMSRVTSRREHEWKVTVALWALLAAGIYYLPKTHPSVLWLAVSLVLVVLGHAFLWVGNHWARSNEDILASFFYADRAHNFVLPDELIQTLRGGSLRPQDWPRVSCAELCCGFLRVPRCLAQILTTVVLAVGLWLACR